jgi:hypothetical protein
MEKAENDGRRSVYGQPHEAGSSASRQACARRTGHVRYGARKMPLFPKSTDYGGNLSNTFLPQRGYLWPFRAYTVKPAYSVYSGTTLIEIREVRIF